MTSEAPTQLVIRFDTIEEVDVQVDRALKLKAKVDRLKKVRLAAEEKLHKTKAWEAVHAAQLEEKEAQTEHRNARKDILDGVFHRREAQA